MNTVALSCLAIRWCLYVVHCWSPARSGSLRLPTYRNIRLRPLPWRICRRRRSSRGTASTSAAMPVMDGPAARGRSPRPTGTGPFTDSGNGFLGGAQAGFNWQIGPAVFGMEADFQGTSGKWTDCRHGRTDDQRDGKDALVRHVPRPARLRLRSHHALRDRGRGVR